MSINDYNKEELRNIHKHLLVYFCYNDSNKLCNKISLNKSGFCEDCNKNISDDKISEISHSKLLDNYIQNEKYIISSIHYLLKECEILTNKKEGITNKEYRTHIVLDIFEIIYNNIFFAIIQPKFLLTCINKIYEIINQEELFFKEFMEKFKYKIYIYCFVLDIFVYSNEYKKNHNINYDFNMSKKTYDNFIKDFIEFIIKYYDNINTKNTTSSKTYKNINIDDLDNLEIVLDL